MASFWDKLAGAASVAQAQADAGELGAVTIESALLPTFTIRPLAQDDQGGGGFSISALLGKLVRPRVTVQTPFGAWTSDPYGPPPSFPWAGVVAGVGLAGLLAVAGYGAYKFVAP